MSEFPIPAQTILDRPGVGVRYERGDYVVKVSGHYVGRAMTADGAKLIMRLNGVSQSDIDLLTEARLGP